MITLQKDQPLFTDDTWGVCEGNDYQDFDLVECYKLSDVNQKVAYYASFIANGEYPQ